MFLTQMKYKHRCKTTPIWQLY